MLNRRDLLKGLGAAGLAATLAPGTAQASLGGTTLGCQAYKVLHIYLHGALSHRETFWVDDPAEKWAEWRQPADLSDLTGDGPDAVRTDFATATDGHRVFLGEGLHPLVAAGWEHRLRVVAMSTPSPAVHRIASGTSIAGIEVGRPGFASLPARMQARWGGEDPYASIVLDALQIPFVARYAVATEGLPSGSSPLVLPIGGDSFRDALDRDEHDRIDGLLGLYSDRYRDALVHPTGGRLRSPAYDVYSSSAERLQDWSGLLARLEVVPTFAPSGDDIFAPTVHGIEVATRLLNSGAKHVTVLGGGGNGVLDTHGLGEESPDGGPSTYDRHSERHNTMIWHISQALLAAIADNRLDPAETLVVVHSEFGRQQRGGDGTDHWGDGYAALLFGGPVMQPGLAGSLKFSEEPKGESDGAFTPADLIAAASLAGGIAPLQPGMFASHQLSRPGGSDEEAIDTLGHDLLGLVDTKCDPDDTDDIDDIKG